MTAKYVKMYPFDLKKSEPGYNIYYKIACLPINDSVQSVQRHRLITVIALRSVGSQISKLSLERQQRFPIDMYMNSDWSDSSL